MISIRIWWPIKDLKQWSPKNDVAASNYPFYILWWTNVFVFTKWSYPAIKSTLMIIWYIMIWLGLFLTKWCFPYHNSYDLSWQPTSHPHWSWASPIYIPDLVLFSGLTPPPDDDDFWTIHSNMVVSRHWGYPKLCLVTLSWKMPSKMPSRNETYR